ncbi:MAG: DUF4336 domain-containing protein [Nannocystaceae bacterium]
MSHSSRASSTLLGLSLADERALCMRSGVDLRKLCILLQRVMWGIHQADVIRIDVEKVLTKLRASFPELFLVDLAEGYVHWTSGRFAEADAALARARARVSTEHPFAYLMPTDEEWSRAPRPGVLVEVVPGSVWRLATFRTPSLRPWLETNATIIRRKCGGLILMNPGKIEPDVLTQIRQLGELTHIVTPVKFHNLFIEEATRAFPNAKNVGTPGHGQNPASKHLKFDGILNDESPLFPGEFDQLTVHGFELGEVLFFHRASRTLLVNDLLFSNRRGCGVPFEMRLYAFAFGLHNRVGIPSYHPLLWLNLKRMQACIRRALEWDFDRVSLAHGPWQAVGPGARDELANALKWFLELSPGGMYRRMGTFFYRQPTFLRDFVAFKARGG